MAPHSSVLAWEIPWMEEPGGLQSMGSHRVGHHRATSLSLFKDQRWWGGKNSTVNPSDNTGLNCSKQQAVLSHVWLFVTPWMEPARLLCLWSSPGKNTGGGCHFLLQGIFPTQGSNSRRLGVLHWQADSLPGKPGSELHRPTNARFIPEVDSTAYSTTPSLLFESRDLEPRIWSPSCEFILDFQLLPKLSPCSKTSWILLTTGVCH